MPCLTVGMLYLCATKCVQSVSLFVGCFANVVAIVTAIPNDWTIIVAECVPAIALLSLKCKRNRWKSMKTIHVFTTRMQMIFVFFLWRISQQLGLPKQICKTEKPELCFWLLSVKCSKSTAQRVRERDGKNWEMKFNWREQTRQHRMALRHLTIWQNALSKCVNG